MGNPGVVVVVPFWSQSDNLNADSNYAYLRVVVPELARLAPRALWLITFPDPQHGGDRWRYMPDDFQTERIKFFPWPYETAMRASVLGFDAARFAWLDIYCGPTIYWLHQVEMGTFVAGGTRQSYNANGRPSVVAQHHYVIHRSLPYPLDGLFPRRWLQLGGSLAADRVVYNSAHARRMGAESFGELVNAAQLAALDAKSLTLPFGLVSGDEPRVAPDDERPPALIYNHRFEGYKQPEVTARVIAKLRARGLAFEVIATQVKGMQSGRLPVDRVLYAPRRDDYLANIALPGINTINSTHETFCIAALDSLIVGHLAVWPRGVTFTELVPPGYPYLFRDPAEQEAMLAHLLTHWPAEFARWSPVLADHARARFGLRGYARDYLHLLAAVEADRPGHPKENTAKAVEAALATLAVGQTATLHAVANAARRAGTLAEQSFPDRRIVRWLRDRPEFSLHFAPGQRGPVVAIRRDAESAPAGTGALAAAGVSG